MNTRERCPWCVGHADYERYHDEEWGVPVHDERVLFEMLTLEGAQAGLSWLTVLRKREGYRRAFDGFDPARIARYRPARIEKLLRDPGIVRNRLKVESVVGNARALLELREAGGTLDALLWGIRRRPAAGQPLARPARDPGLDRAERRDEQGAQAPRLPLRRQHDLLRLHAGGRHGRRPPARMLAARAGRR